jgi:hypothetical protein
MGLQRIGDILPKIMTVLPYNPVRSLLYNTTMRVIKRTWGLVLLLVMLATNPTNIFAQQPDSLYFAETGHWVRGQFLQYYQSAPDPLLLFGYPISEEVIDPTNGQASQYFQRARFDLVYADQGLTVRQADLGALLYQPGSPAVPLSASPTCRRFPVTGKDVCYAFLQFYDAHEGAAYFGNPLSELEIHDGRYVQYFERTRLEWQPEMPSGHRVAISDLGKVYMDSRLGEAARLTDPNNRSAPGQPTHIIARAFVDQALLPANSRQTVYIVVQDVNLMAVANANVVVAVFLPDGLQDVYRPVVTNVDGISRFSFDIGNLPVKEVVRVEVDVESQGMTSHTVTWFRIWW